jgi:hypothetical protein
MLWPRQRESGKLSSTTIVENLKLPTNLNTSNAQFCKVVHVCYLLQIGISDTKIKIPITISLVPVNQASFVAPYQQPVVQVPNAPADNRTYSDMPSAPPAVVPPREMRKCASV